MGLSKSVFQDSQKPEGFESWLRAHTSLGQSSIDQYVGIINSLLKAFPEDPPGIDDINLYLRQHPRPHNVAAIKYYMKRAGFSRADREEKLIRFRRKPTRPREIIKVEDLLQLIDAMDRENRQIGLFLFNTGARCHEAFKVKLKDVSPEGWVTLETKGGKYRKMKLSPEYNREIQDYLRNIKGIGAVENVFYTESTASLKSKVRMFDRALNDQAKKYLGKRVGTHDFRRLVAIHLYRVYRDLLLLQRILGHGDIKTTEAYVKYAITEEDIDKASKAIQELVKRKPKTV